MKVWVITNSKQESFVSVHATKESAEKYKQEITVWSQVEFDLRIKEVKIKS